MIKKSQKSLYKVTKRWYLIALLLVIDKVVETITAHRLTTAAETAEVLSETQIRNCMNYSTKHVMNLITSQVQTVWESKCHVASLLSLNIAGVFDIVNHTWLLHVIWQRGTLFWLLCWLSSFLTDHTKVLLFDDQKSTLFQVTRGVSHSSSLLPILFLFYNYELLETCTSQRDCFFSTDFVNDINILTYRISTEKNYQCLQTAFV